jgi:hypothetical protein
MTYSVFNQRVRDLMHFEGMSMDEARMSVKEDMLSDKVGEVILRNDPGYQQWVAMMDKLDRKYREEMGV